MHTENPVAARKRMTLPRGKHLFSAEKHTVIYAGSVPLAEFVGFCEVKIPNETKIKIDSEGPVKFYRQGISQTTAKSSTETFTTLDRPDPLSPEMRAVHEIQRRNEIQREEMRAEMERRIASIESANRRDTRKNKTGEKVEVAGNGNGSSEKSADQERKVEGSEPEVPFEGKVEKASGNDGGKTPKASDSD